MKYLYIPISLLLSILCVTEGFSQTKNGSNARITEEHFIQKQVNEHALFKKPGAMILQPGFRIGGTPYPDPEQNFAPPRNLEYAGDLNGDGYSDFYISVFAADETTDDLSDRLYKTKVYYGSENGLSEDSYRLYRGQEINFLTDFNGDGLTDGYRISEDNSVILLSYYPDDDLHDPEEFPRNETNIDAQNLRSYGDYDGDGYNDMITYGNSVFNREYGEVRVIYGAQYIEDTRIEKLKFEYGQDFRDFKMLYSDIDDDGETEFIQVSSNSTTGVDGTSSGVWGTINVLKGSDDSEWLEMVYSDTVDSYFFENDRDAMEDGKIGVLDLNGDGLEELVVSFGDKLEILEQSNIEGEYFKPGNLVWGTFNVDDFSIVGDYNGDNAQDLLVFNNEIGLRWISSDSELNIKITKVSEQEYDFLYPVTNMNKHINSSGDVNGDGLDDITVEFYNGEKETYGYRVYYGNESGSFSEANELVFNDPYYEYARPYFIVNAGDLNADEIDDFGIVYDGVDEFRLFFGGALKDDPEPDMTFGTGDNRIYHPATGDFNGDGISDLIISFGYTTELENDGAFHIYYGGSDFDADPDHTVFFSTAYPGEEGNIGNVRNIGDINGDGADDISYASEDVRETTRILLGGESISNTYDLVINRFYTDAIAAGDFNEDGRNDFFLMDSFNNRAYLYSGYDESGGGTLNTEPVLTMEDPSLSEEDKSIWYLGLASAVGDFNGDDAPDLALKAYLHTNDAADSGTEAIYIYEGGADADSLADGSIGISTALFAGTYATVEGEYFERNLGSISAVPDQNSDGADELVFSTATYQTNAAVFYGGELDTMGTNAGIIFEAPNAYAGLGVFANYIYAANGAPAVGDFDGDGRNEFIFGQRDDFNFIQKPVYLYESDSFVVSNENRGGEIAEEFRLNQNYPNPFNPTTQISYTIPKAGLVELKIYDMLGREIRTLVKERQAAGLYSLNFDASSLSSGLYIYRLISGEYVETRKMTLIK